MKPELLNTLGVLLVTAALSVLLWAPITSAQEGNKTESITLKDGKAKVQSALKTDDAKDKLQKYQCKVFTVILKGGKAYTFHMVSKEIDSFLRLEDAAGKELAKDDDSGGFVNARINFHCSSAGPYRVVCTTFGGGTGAFSLTIQESALAKAENLTLKEGMVNVDAKLTTMDSMDAVQTHSACKIFAITLAKEKAYQIDMISKDIDSFLRLEDPTGKELAKDDDGGDGRNARIRFNCPKDGEYRIIATTYFGGTGSFSLLVKESKN
jgi:hypothetical protein